MQPIPITPLAILTESARIFEVELADMQRKCRSNSVAMARFSSFYAAERLMKLNHTQIAKLFDRERSLVSYGLKVVKTALGVDLRLRARLEELLTAFEPPSPSEAILSPSEDSFKLGCGCILYRHGLPGEVRMKMCFDHKRI